ncbi:MAG: carboxyl transferase domain-containing protein [Enterocloster sp.]
MPRQRARLTYAYANASVPKVTVVVKEAFGSAYLTMGSKSIGADVVYAWPNAVIGMMNPAEAVKIMYAGEISRIRDDAAALISEEDSRVHHTSVQRCSSSQERICR